jgi:hypothetical protein
VADAAPRSIGSSVAVRTALTDVHVLLGVAGSAILGCEYGYHRAVSDAWLVLEAALALGALLWAWRRQDQLRFGPLLALAAGLQLGFVLLHLSLGLPGDPDSRIGGVFDRQGRSLLDGDYPRSEYPLGAVLIFALEAGLSGGHTRAANALAMVPFQLLVVASIWACRTNVSRWLAALVAFMPLNAFYWEYRFDLVVAGLLLLGLVLALRERWSWSAAALGVGALVKWTPGLAAVVLAAWLLASGRRALAARFVLVFGVLIAVVYVPFLLWDADDVLAAYTRQGGRTITPETIWYLPLRALGLAHVRSHLSFSAGAPGWANAAAAVLQALAVLAIVALCLRVRGNLRAAAALGALTPVAFLLTNRIFSPQFLLVIVAGWAFAAALVLETRRQQLVFGLAASCAVGANAFVYPFALPHYAVTWVLCSSVLFAVAVAVTVWLAVSAGRAPRTGPRSP